MLLKNISTESGLVNGARGIVSRFVQKEGKSFPVVVFEIHMGEDTFTEKSVIEESCFEVGGSTGK
jgi:hypothetical protein